MKDQDLSYVFEAGKANKRESEILPPKALSLEPDLPVWSPSEFEGVVIHEPVHAATDPVTQTLTGLFGLVVGLLVSWLRRRFA